MLQAVENLFWRVWFSNKSLGHSSLQHIYFAGQPSLQKHIVLTLCSVPYQQECSALALGDNPDIMVYGGYNYNIYSNHNQLCAHSHCMHSAVPDRVRRLRFVPSTNGNTLSVEWSRPQSDVPILYYEVQYRSHTGSRFWQGPVRATAETVTLRGNLVPSATYGVQVRAVSAIGEGPYSREETVKRLFKHTHTHVYTHTHTHTYTHTHTHTHKHTHTQAHTHIYIHRHATCTCTHVHTDIQYTHTYIHTNTMKCTSSILCHIIKYGAKFFSIRVYACLCSIANGTTIYVFILSA